MREEQGSLSRRENALAGAQRQLAAVRAAHQASLHQFQTTMTATRDKLARVCSENVKREEAVRLAVKNKTAITDEHNRRRGLRETTRERAVVAADAAGCPLLPKREWKPLVKGSSASAGAPEALPPYTVVPAPVALATASAPPASTAAPSDAAAAASSSVVSATAAACSACLLYTSPSPRD